MQPRHASGSTFCSGRLIHAAPTGNSGGADNKNRRHHEDIFPPAQYPPKGKSISRLPVTRNALFPEATTRNIAMSPGRVLVGAGVYGTGMAKTECLLDRLFLIFNGIQEPTRARFPEKTLPSRLSRPPFSVATSRLKTLMIIITNIISVCKKVINHQCF